jgi:hypothetical protein
MVLGYTSELGTSIEGYTIQATDYVTGPFTSNWIDPIGQYPRAGNCVPWGANVRDEVCNHGRRIVHWPAHLCQPNGALWGGNVTDCIQWDNGGVPYCPLAEGANISVEYVSDQFQQKCTYDQLPSDRLFTNYYDSYFQSSVIDGARTQYCNDWHNIDTPECIARLTVEGTYTEKVLEACLELANDQEHVAHQWPMMEENINGLNCKDAIIIATKTQNPITTTVGSGRINEYCRDTQVVGDVAQVKGAFDPACSCVNMLNTSQDCAPYHNACRQSLDAGRMDGPGCPAACAEKMRLADMFSTANTDTFVSQVKHYFDTQFAGPYCYTNSCAGGNKNVFMETIQAGCNMNVQLCLVDAEKSVLNDSTITATCKEDMGIQDTSGCVYSEWAWTPCVSNNKTGTRTVIHQPIGQLCDNLATVSVCGGTTTGEITGGTPVSGSKSQGKNFWIIIGIMIAIMLVLLGFVVF